ncbi:GntR family transcriptional regulator [Thermosipho melanesiensis]|uniref:Regulatory protein GntR, HTH n=2 Tax=Thermosipho melanesiensis TaxID=46541 RepID=A6LLS2_THEM4|nr:GntR family transcriptional regulator [Thermosipho melanesiensis]ABR30873.1 regulatory protein GntR, HTH [Thermosipho melanesiensis BI429]APT73992.1 GntR family transcriptional regulator [Thermosipho melanesiensis]OOC35922.1 GntR family transcriptional regulator [Thermosipho melanesiensis]OOC38424.1 GntR family transcriptional regulator [Thermosipho melanesiensis]OOC38885.1 GntR family transcriptional regulator [Thermosipho melanesiensis]
MIPLYLRIANFIETKILKGDYLPGDKIPSENVLAEEFNTTRSTVRKALSELEKKGIITRVFGIGTFVTEINVISKKKIGIIVQNTKIVYGIIKFCSKIGSKCFVVESIPNLEAEKNAIKELLSMGVDGIIMEPTIITMGNEILKSLLNSNFPIVFVDRNIDIGMSVPTVLNDNYHGGKILGEHMRKYHKTKKPLYVTSEDLTISSVQERYQGISSGLKIKPEILKIPTIDGDYSKLVKLSKNFDTIFFCNDMMAVRGITTLLKANVKIPEDVKIVGYDNDYVSKVIEPPLTTINQDLSLIGETAASLIVRLIKKENIEMINRIKSNIVVRNSCGCGKGEKHV